MKRKIVPGIALFAFMLLVSGYQYTLAQTYDVLDYNLNGTPVNGVKIKTNLPFVNGSQMVNLRIEGYSYGKSATLGINVVYYIYNGSFINTAISSWGNDTPPVSLANEGGKVVLFINDKVYYQRFKVTAFVKGMYELSTWFQGWLVADEPLTATYWETPSYQNKFGNIHATGNVGIGIAIPNEKLAVNGNIRAKEIKVETANWPDYVFSDDYQLPGLKETEAYIKIHRRLPGMPSAKEVEADGISLGEMNRKLLEKVEELTLHLIEQRNYNHTLEERIKRIELNQNAVVKN